MSMSRSSKGFADFFPTAPKVLKDKRSRPIDPSSGGHDYLSQRGADVATHPALPSNAADHRNGVNGISPGPDHRPSRPAKEISAGADAPDAPQNEGLNHLGSASSTSTASSPYSQSLKAQEPAAKGRRENGPPSLTPITNIDSPLSGAEKSPYGRKPDSALKSRAAASVSTKPAERLRLSTNGVSSNGTPNGRSPAAVGESKGLRITYDPELDTSLSSKERRSRKPEYKEIAQRVSWDQQSPLS